MVSGAGLMDMGRRFADPQQEQANFFVFDCSANERNATEDVYYELE